ncbi:MAG TPA: thioesterase family protein [Gaiellaceae bacterium]|nr:thioesterase family protein [Gaiellaceae bacterium]
MEGYGFSTHVRVRFADTDAQGIAHNAAYNVWFEVARVEYLRAFAGGYQALRDHGIEALVLESFCRYRQPARFDDELDVHARCGDVRGARFRFEYAITRARLEASPAKPVTSGQETRDALGAPWEVVAEGWTAHACVDATSFRPVRVPGWLVDAIRSAESSS